MNVRNFSPVKDYLMICEWWVEHGWPVCPLNFLPETGLIMEEDGKPFCVGFIYGTDSDFCLMEFIVSNPKSDKEKRSLAIDELIEKLLERAKEQGYRAVYSFAQNQSLLARCVKQGFEVTDTNVTNILRRL